jgi:poly(hydroxyalkanoate) depolymerase family esterase
MTSNVNMADIARLTRAGRLAEAMTLLHKLHQNAKPPEATEGLESTAMGFLRKPFAGLRHRRFGSGQVTSPRPDRRADPMEGLAPPYIPEAKSSFLELLKAPGSTRNLHSLEDDLESAVQAPIPEGARFDEHSYSNEAGSRTYKLFIPSRYSGQPLPLVVMLHGCKQSPDDFALGTKMNELAEEQGFLAAYPRQPRSANPIKCWNWFSPDDQLRDKGEPSLIAGITRQIMRDFAVDPACVYAAGLSAGGAAAAIMGSAYPDLYAAIGVHSGLACGAAKDLPSAFAAMRGGGSTLIEGANRPLPTIVFHGDCDTTVSPVNGEQIIAQSKAAAEFSTRVSQGHSAGGIAYTCTVQADGSGCPILEQWTLHGAGHAWSGGNPAGSYTDPRGPDASREMLRFFRKHAWNSQD